MNNSTISGQSSKRRATLVLFIMIVLATPACTRSSTNSNSLPLPTEAGSNSKKLENNAEQKRFIPPDKLLPSIRWAGLGGGGGGDGNGYFIASCNHDSPYVYLIAVRGSILRYQMELTSPISQGEWVFIKGCNYPEEEAIFVTFFLPDGTTERISTTTKNLREGKIWWQSLPNEPLGQYRVEISSASSVVNKTFIVSNPSQPVLKVACFVDEPYGSAVLTGFKPNERVLLARYGPEKLLDHDFVDMDENGTALITIPHEFTLIVAIGQDRPNELEILLSEDTSNLWMQVSAYNVLADEYCVTR